MGRKTGASIESKYSWHRKKESDPKMKICRRTLPVLLAAGFFVPAVTQALTRVSISTNIIQSNVQRMGINMGDDYWNSPTLKKRTEYNFEGILYRQCHKGELQTNGFATYWGNTNRIALYQWDTIYTNGATFRILSGEAKGTTGRIVRLEARNVDVTGYGDFNDQPFFVFETPVALSSNALREVGLLIENSGQKDLGYLGAETYWKTAGTTLITHDQAPGSFGTACARLDGASNAIVRMPTHLQRLDDSNEDWNVRFFARKESGTPTLTLSAESNRIVPTNITLSSSWQQFDLTVTASGIPTPDFPAGDKQLIFELVSGGTGTVLLDDIEVWKAGQTNSTPFSDSTVQILKKLNPGIIRHLRIGGGTVSNAIPPRLKQFGVMFGEYSKPGVYSGTDGYYYKDEISIHEQAELCEEIDADPWFCIPGTIYPEEVSFFVDYLAGTTSTPGGKFRSALGHPQPWAEVFTNIYVEFGNEAWNTATSYKLGGFNGANYWHDLIAAGKSTASYQPNIQFMAAGQNFISGMADRILNETTNADRYAIAPYMLHNIYTNDLSIFANDREMFEWFMAYPLFRIHDLGMPEQKTVMDETGIEFSIYEYNYHSNQGDLTETIDARNRFLTSASHGVSIANSMLAMLKTCGIRSQCFFTLGQFGFENVRLWGSVTSFRQDQPRYRPAFHAMESINKVIQGDLVETVQSGDNPGFSVTGTFESASPLPKIYPELYSYAFKDQTTNGLVLANYDLTSAQQVEIALPEYVTGFNVQKWTLTSSSFTNNNEPELSSPQVTLVEETITNFQNGAILDVPPSAVVSYRWLSAGTIPQFILSHTLLSIAEGTSAELTLRLSVEPPEPVTVSFSPAQMQNAQFSVTAGETMIFNDTNWNLPQTVTVACAEDAYGIYGTGTLRLSAAGYVSEDIALREIDDDPAGTNIVAGTLLFDFGSADVLTTDTGWNNVTTLSIGTPVVDTVDSTGTHTGISLEITDAFGYVITRASAVLPQYPHSACTDYFRVNSDNPVGGLKLTGLDPAMQYELLILSSGTQNYGSEAGFVVNGISQTIDSYYNSTLLVFSNIALDAASEITISVDHQNAGIGPLNLIQLNYSTPFEPEDTDTDNLPDWWEDLHGFGQTGADPETPAANGINTLLGTYIAGLNPLNAGSKLLIQTLGPLQWNAVSGRVYTIYWTSSLLENFQTLETNITGNAFTDLIHSAESKGFYKIDVRIE